MSDRTRISPARAAGDSKPAPPVLPRGAACRQGREERISDGELSELQTAFTLMDQNSDGKICREDLRASFSMLQHSKPTEAVIDNVMHAVGNTSGEIDEQAFIMWMQSHNQGPQTPGEDSVLLDAFNVLDQDGDGFLHLEDLRNGMHMMGQNLSEKMLHLMFTEADRDKDGIVNYEDFVYVLKK